MKIIQRNSIHLEEKSFDTLFCQIEDKLKLNINTFKITYKAYNGVESCNVEMFDGRRWNPILSMYDLGMLPDTHAFNVYNEKQRELRATELFERLTTLCIKIL